MTVKAFTLDGFAKAVSEADGVVHLKDLEPNSSLVVVTDDDKEYDITFVDPGSGLVSVKGGQFSEPTECRLNGSTMGGSMLWMKRIAIGMCVEFWTIRGVVTTGFVKIIGWRTNGPVPASNPPSVH